MGLAFGSIPFLLKENGVTYANLATFSLVSLPYSLKLFLAPLVDSLYSRSFGRRKSWIVPIQLIIGLTMSVMAHSIHVWVSHGSVQYLTPTFMLLLAMTATQDIAVDGWSLTILQRRNVSYASTCQSLGLSAGYFSSFTIFLAFSNTEFCDNYVRPLLPFSSTTGPLLSLHSALRMSGLYYLFLTIFITFFKRELQEEDVAKKSDEETLDGEGSDTSLEILPGGASAGIKIFKAIRSTYSDLAVVVRKPAVRSLVFALLIAKVGFSAYDNVATLKLLELGFSKESMASMAVLNTPVVLFGSIFTGRLVAKRSPIEVYLYGFFMRFIISLTGPACARLLAHRNGVVTPGFYLLILIVSNLYSLASECLMFIAIGAFFLNVSSSSVHVAGSYLTLLNTSSNMGGTWHKAIVLWLVDRLTTREDCAIPPDSPAGTLCPIRYDGFYIISFALMPVAAAVGLHLRKSLFKLSKLPDAAWKAKPQTE